MERFVSILILCALMAGCSENPQEVLVANQSSGSLISSSQIIDSPSSSTTNSSQALEPSSSQSISVPSAGSSLESSPPPHNSGMEDATVKSEKQSSRVSSSSTPLEGKETAPNPAKKSWTLAYDSFYCGKKGAEPQEVKLMEVSDVSLQIRDNLIFPVYTASSLKELNEIDSSGTLPRLTSFYGAILEKTDGSYYGEGLFDHDNIMNQVTQFDVGKYESRMSMTITESVEGQLEKGGFTPEKTRASALAVGNIGSGILFDNGESKLFYLQAVGIKGVELGYKNGMMIDFCAFISDCEKYLPSKENIPQPDGNHTNSTPHANPATGKPVIYLYPEKETQIEVQVDYQGEFTYTYPAYNKGWNVTAHPDGKLINNADSSEHYYLFWEGDKTWSWDFSKGFVVKGRDTESFLKEKLSYMGLTPREYNDFITYWVPEMKENPYNLITFAQEEYEKLAPMTITPTPDSLLRVHMVYKSCTSEQTVQPQTLKPFERKGFTAVEWGGTRAR